jgi:hypothetical protein
VANVRITLDGKLALTVDQAAERYGLERSSVSAALTRGHIDHDGMLDGKKKIYLAARLDRLILGRPGRGSNKRKAQP